MNIWKKTSLKSIKKKKINYHPFNESIWKSIVLKKIKLNKKYIKKKFTNFFLACSPLSLILLNYI